MYNPSIPQIASLLILLLDVATNLKSYYIISLLLVLKYNLKVLVVHLSIKVYGYKQFRVAKAFIDEKAHLYITYQMDFPKK